MNDFAAHLCGRRNRFLPVAVLFFALFLMYAGAFAAPGAHGPNGEHLDAPAAAAAAAGTEPRMEARSETFELVAHLREDELSMLINRFETNEPVLEAKVEVESGAVKAVAKFHSDLGDYAIDDPAFLKALKTPGAQALVITVLAGTETDLLEGTLQGKGVDGQEHDEARGRGGVRSLWLVLALLACGAVFYMLGRRSRRVEPVGGAR